METMITARHCEIPETLRARAGSLAERLGSLAPRPTRATIVFDADGDVAVAEIRLHARRRELFVARGDGPDHRSALDRAEARIRRQATTAAARARTGRRAPANAPAD